VWRAVLCLVGLIGCTTSGSPAVPGATPFQPGIELAGSIQALQAGATTTSFNFAHQDVVWVRVKTARLDHIATISFNVISPRGNLMYEAVVPFSADESVTAIPLPDMNHPVTVQRAKPVTGGYHLNYPIAIAGSSFTKYPEPGAWQIVAQVAETDQRFTAQMDVTVLQ
jgi:hypothetical protein